MLMVGADNEELMISIRKGNKALTFILKIHKEGGFSTALMTDRYRKFLFR